MAGRFSVVLVMNPPPEGADGPPGRVDRVSHHGDIIAHVGGKHAGGNSAGGNSADGNYAVIWFPVYSW